MLFALQDGELLRALSELAARVLARHEGKLALSRSDALEIQIALAVDLAMATALNPKRLAAMQLGSDVVCHPGQPALLRWKGLTAGEGEGELAPSTTKLLDLYIRIARARLQPACEHHLFPGAAGRAKHPIVLSRQIAELIERETRTVMTGSQFKWVLGARLLMSDPINWEHVRDLLGYRTIEAAKHALGPFLDQCVFTSFDDELGDAR